VGIGTGSPSAPLNSVQFNDNNFFGGSSNFVFNGSNVGIGTSLSKNTLDIAGDVSIGTAYAGHRAGPSNGIIIQGSVGIGTFNPANNLSVVGGASIGATAFANTAAPANGLIVSGSVGIGTALPANSLSVVGGASIGTAAFANTAAPANGLIVSGALGIGIAAPGQAVDVLGNVRDTGEIVNGDVGIGTAAFQTALAVTNGDVGIGTWAPGAALEVNGQINETGVGGTTGALNTTANGIYSWNGGGRYIRFNTNGSYNDFESEGQPMVINYDGAQNVNFFGGGGGNGTVSIGVGPSAGARLMVYGTDNSFTNSAFNVFNSSSVSLMLVKDNGNVGIGSTAPGQLLDVQGTVRTVGFTMSGQGPVSGYVLTANDSKGDATWTSPATAGGWTVSGSNVYETGGGNVGIGTTFITGGAALTVMNGNVGIGTWAPASILTIENSAGTLNELILNNGEKGTPLAYTNAYTPTFTVNESEVNGSRPLWFGYQNAGHTLWDSYVTLGACGSFSQMCFDMGSNTSGTVINSAIVSSSSNLAIGGTNLNAGLLPGFSADDGNAVNVYFGNTGNTLIPNGNVGIGSLTPGKALDVQGTVRMTGLTLTGNSAANGNVLVSNSIGVGTWMPASTLGPIVGTNYWSLTAAAGNVGISTTNTVGIGTTFAGSGAGLVVMNGNVGIGTWAPSSALIVQGGNVGIGTAVANYKLQVGGCSNVDGTTSCVDLAELIPSSEPVSAGDIVMLDDQRSVTVKKAVSSNNNLLFGVVTTDPAIVIEGSSVGIINGSGFKLQPLKPGVALAGRIPVKVNLENGPIRVGDMITSSSVPGIGAKAVKAGRVVGIALEPMDHIKNGLYAKIIVYDDPHWWQGLEGSSEGMRSTVSALAQEVQQLRADVDALKQKVFSGR
jgi:hypothetical protein